MKFKAIIILIPALFISLVGSAALAQNGLSSFAEGLPALKIESNGEAETTYSLSLQILALMTGLTLLPSIVLGATSFTRIIIVLSILRQAMGTQQTPPNQVLIAIALFLTFFIMTPTLTEINRTALDPYLEGDGSRTCKSGSLHQRTAKNCICNQEVCYSERLQKSKLFCDWD